MSDLLLDPDSHKFFITWGGKVYDLSGFSDEGSSVEKTSESVTAIETPNGKVQFSMPKRGLSKITVTYPWGADENETLQTIFNAQVKRKFIQSLAIKEVIPDENPKDLHKAVGKKKIFITKSATKTFGLAEGKGKQWELLVAGLTGI